MRRAPAPGIATAHATAFAVPAAPLLARALQMDPITMEAAITRADTTSSETDLDTAATGGLREAGVQIVAEQVMPVAEVTAVAAAVNVRHW